MAVDLNGNIVEVDDGGVYRRSSPTARPGNWTSIGDSSLRVTEFHSVAYDNHGGVIIGGTQDVGTVQQSASGSMTWDTVNQGDGGVVAVFDRPGTGGFIPLYQRLSFWRASSGANSISEGRRLAQASFQRAKWPTAAASD